MAAAPHVSVNVILVQQKMDIFFHTHCNHKTAEEAAVSVGAADWPAAAVVAAVVVVVVVVVVAAAAAAVDVVLAAADDDDAVAADDDDVGSAVVEYADVFAGLAVAHFADDADFVAVAAEAVDLAHSDFVADDGVVAVVVVDDDDDDAVADSANAGVAAPDFHEPMHVFLIL